MFKSIRKRDGKVVSFKEEKIVDAITKAGAATEEFGLYPDTAQAYKAPRSAAPATPPTAPSIDFFGHPC